MQHVASARRLQSLLASALFLSLLSAPAWAQKQKVNDLAGYPLLWTAKKSPLAPPFVPGLNAALLLSEEQKEKLMTIRKEVLDDPKLQALGAKVKANASASEAEREAAQKAREEAQDAFKSRVETVLTAEQRKLVGLLNTLFDEVQTATQEAFRNQFEQVVKTDKARQEELRREVREQTVKAFRSRLEGTLVKEQWAAFAKAAESEEAAAKNAVKIKQP